MDYPDILRLNGHSNFVEDCCYSADSSRIVSCSGDQTVLLWDTQTGQKTQTIGKHDAEVWSCDFSPFGIYICSASSDKTVRIWDQRVQGEVATFKGHTKTVWSCTFHQSWSSWKLASASSDNSVKIWNWKTLSVEQTIENHQNNVDHVSFSNNGQSLVTCGRDWTVQILENYSDKSERKLKILAKHRSRVNYCCFSGTDDELVLSCSDDRTVKVWDRVTLANTKTFTGHLNNVWSCDTRPLGDRTILVSCSSDKTVRFWDMQDGSELRKIRTMDNEIESEDQLLCCRFSPDMSQLAVCSNNGNLYLIEMRGIVQKMLEHFT
ncbi:WD-40 repeat-containing [Paramuricea clavata]|uniref:WD-40 repeat-containing n=1 Tax=Paramuricea clavata TaxID=317549 RepID=A0A6S7I0N0_PARCT|nr:WD-40 repeat-containing [Paramuricea clavata]